MCTVSPCLTSSRNYKQFLDLSVRVRPTNSQLEQGQVLGSIAHFSRPTLGEVAPRLPGIPPRTEDMLEFIVVGGGIAGLATAYSLQQAGHQVTVFERSVGHSKSRDVVRSPPNMTCILDYWGMGEPLAKRSVRISGSTLIAGATGERLGVFIIPDKLMKTLPGNFYYIQHTDLHTMLYDFAKRAGVKILHGMEVVSVDPWSGTVTTAKGAKMSADVIIGADGYRSVVRPVVVGPQAFEGVRDKYLSVNLIIPADKMRQHEDLAPFVENSDVQ
ncbi:hypothetical protein BU15DRAFT_61637 [Melanogaster broomeanus]|nr:hypothetical protein BU15DRAFT_61637 [Melanogaster broomeanus]